MTRKDERRAEREAQWERELAQRQAQEHEAYIEAGLDTRDEHIKALTQPTVGIRTITDALVFLLERLRP
jgi:hypothetical protein